MRQLGDSECLNPEHRVSKDLGRTAHKDAAAIDPLHGTAYHMLQQVGPVFLILPKSSASGSFRWRRDSARRFETCCQFESRVASGRNNSMAIVPFLLTR